MLTPVPPVPLIPLKKILPFETYCLAVPALSFVPFATFVVIRNAPISHLAPAARSTAISRILQLFRPYCGFGRVDCGAAWAMKLRYDFLVWICW